VPDGDGITDDTIRTMPEEKDPGSALPTPKRSGFASTISRMINPSSAAGGTERA
jgi:hypothetical protein